MSEHEMTQAEQDQQRADHFEFAFTQAAVGKCWASGMTLVECKRTDLCDCFDFEWVRP